MSDLKLTSARNEDKKEFDVHPKGTFMAVCRDIWVERKDNPKYPGTNPWGNPEPKQLVKVCVDFLTDEPIEIGGKMLPRFIRFKANNSWGEKAALRDFVSRWDPAMGKMDEVDLEQLVGRGAYLTIDHNTGKDGNTWANVVGVAPPPKGATIPMVPAEFVRHKDKQGAGTSQLNNEPFRGANEEDLSF